MGRSNEGVTGVESIRLGGMAIDKLPIAEAALTKQQLPVILEDARENKIVNIRAKFPKQTVDWINGAINECNASIKNVRDLIGRQRTMIDEYTGLISLCRHRDKELMKLHDTENADKIKVLKKQFPLYDVKAMRQQVQQCNEAIYRSDKVIDQEHDSISMLKELMVKCKKRDDELKALGA